MGLKKLASILILLTLFLMPMIIALDTEITVKTQPNYAVNIRVSNIDGSGTLKDPYPSGAFLDKIADENGTITITYSSEIINMVDISLMIKNAVGGSTIKFEGGAVQLLNNGGEHFKAGWPVKIDATINPPIAVSEKPVGETNTAEETTGNELDVVVEVEEDEEEDEEEPVVEESEEIDAEKTVGITGKAIAGVKDVATSRITYYIIGGIVLILIIIFVLKKKLLKKILPKKKGSIEFGVKKDGDEKKSMSTREELEDAEKKLDEARKELEEVKGKDEKEEKIRQIKARFDRDKKALEDLEKE